MPTLNGIEVLRAWRHRGEDDRILFIISTHDGGTRRLYEPDSSEFGRVLDAALRAQGYEGL